ncbi:MAG: tyrosine-type recombinase/integrase [Bryobacteraceae bacterium]|jgi:integrase
MAVYKRGDVWWFKFSWKGELIRESTKQGNKRVAEQIESARKTQLAKGEVGIRDKKPVPALARFAEHDFLPFVRSTSAAKPRTVVFYENSVRNLMGYDKLVGLKMDAITSEVIAGFVAKRRDAGMQVSTINRDLATLRRMFHLAQEWERVTSILPKVRMLPGENQRERVLTSDEELRYLDAAVAIGDGSLRAFDRALEGIRATVRGERPIRPADPFLLRDVVTILLDCGLRPEECHRLKWENIRDGAVEIFKGKRKASRRRVPACARSLAVLAMRKATTASEWVFPSTTKSGHIESSTLKKQHRVALAASGVSSFVIYDLRHTCLTRWAKTMDPFTLMKLAGHADLNTTMHYVHLNDDDVRAAMEKAEVAKGGHKTRHNIENAGSGPLAVRPVLN